jgi:hypothetical protein
MGTSEMKGPGRTVDPAGFLDLWYSADSLGGGIGMKPYGLSHGYNLNQ